MIIDIKEEVERLKKDIKELYQSDELPWIIGYSGGKDSTTCVQLVWQALLELPASARKKSIHVISTDTLVENPVVATWVTNSLKKMELSAIESGLPIYPHRLVPDISDRFWVNLIGKGYPSPRPKFRWCTERLKIKTATNFIQNMAETNGEAILVLGTRRAESNARAKTIAKYESSSRANLSRHSDPKLSRVWIYPPIKEWTNDDVWEFIGTYENPWGLHNSDLLKLYRGATPDNECPVVMDTSTQSCGDSRFGCYVCTMVAQDKSMQAMILNDQSKAWMQPILDYRNNYLAPTKSERLNREFKRLNSNRLDLFKDKLVHGPFTQKYREKLLRELLITQRSIKEEAKKRGLHNFDLISFDELEEIRRIWIEEKKEIEDNLPKIYEEVTGKAYKGRYIQNYLSEDDIILLKKTVSDWIIHNANTNNQKILDERISETFQLIRSLIASTYSSNEKKQRSKRIDEIEKILTHYSFIDEIQATEFALKYKNNSIKDEILNSPFMEDSNLQLEEELTDNQKQLLV